jgi:hypothetical protein
MDPIESTPTLQGFTDWVYTVMGIPTTALAPDDAGFAYAFQVALEMVPQNYSD